MYYVDIPQGIKTNELKRKTNQLKNINNHNNKQNIIRYSLPCITYCEELPKPISLLPPLVIDKNRWFFIWNTIFLYHSNDKLRNKWSLFIDGW